MRVNSGERDEEDFRLSSQEITQTTAGRDARTIMEADAQFSGVERDALSQAVAISGITYGEFSADQKAFADAFHARGEAIERETNLGDRLDMRCERLADTMDYTAALTMANAAVLTQAGQAEDAADARSLAAAYNEAAERLRSEMGGHDPGPERPEPERAGGITPETFRDAAGAALAHEQPTRPTPTAEIEQSGEIAQAEQEADPMAVYIERARAEQAEPAAQIEREAVTIRSRAGTRDYSELQVVHEQALVTDTGSAEPAKEAAEVSEIDQQADHLVKHMERAVMPVPTIGGTTLAEYTPAQRDFEPTDYEGGPHRPGTLRLEQEADPQEAAIALMVEQSAAQSQTVEEGVVQAQRQEGVANIEADPMAVYVARAEEAQAEMEAEQGTGLTGGRTGLAGGRGL